MPLSKKIKFVVTILLLLNLTMCFCVIWAFVRTAPIIETIVEQNANSVMACEKMLASLALAVNDSQVNKSLIDSFSLGLQTAESNITESDEIIYIEKVKEKYKQAFNGNYESKTEVITAINKISAINWAVIVRTGKQVKKLGLAGAWGVAFMASLVFFLSMLFYFRLKYQLIQPVEEIYNVINQIKIGEVKRRCSGYNIPYDMKFIHDEINELLDGNSLLYSETKY